MAGLPWLLLSILPLSGAAELPRLSIEAGPEQVHRLADVTFGRKDAPEGLREDAMTRCQVDVSTEVPRREAGLRRKPGSDSCLAEAHVEEIRIRLALKIQVFLPRGAPHVLRAHEEGHARVCREAFARTAGRLAAKTYRAFPSSFGWEAEPGCSAAEMQRRASEALQVLDSGFAQAVQDGLLKVLDEGRERYDRQTQNGLSDSPDGESATVRGQRQAAQAVIQALFGNGKGETERR